MRTVLLFLGVSYLALILLALFADKLIFQPHASSYTDPQFNTLRAQSIHPVRIPSGHDTISAIYLPNPQAKYTLLYSHGNAEDIGDDLPTLEEFRNAGFAVFAYDYRGYGTSTGKPSENGLYQDVTAAYDYLTQSLHVEPARVISFGHSLGSAAAIHLASTRPVAGLIAGAPFLSAFRVLTRIPLLPWDKFNNASKIRNVHCPVLIIHGRRDEVIPWWHGERMFELANAPKRYYWIDSGMHNDGLVVARDAYLQAINDFAASIAPRATSS